MNPNNYKPPLERKKYKNFRKGKFKLKTKFKYTLNDQEILINLDESRIDSPYYRILPELSPHNTNQQEQEPEQEQEITAKNINSCNYKNMKVYPENSMVTKPDTPNPKYKFHNHKFKDRPQSNLPNQVRLEGVYNSNDNLSTSSTTNSNSRDLKNHADYSLSTQTTKKDNDVSVSPELNP